MADDKKYIALETTSQEIRTICGSTAVRIGDKSSETGGSATEGTVFAKLNKLIEQLTTVVSSIGTDEDGATVQYKLTEIVNRASSALDYRFYEGGHVLAEYAGGKSDFSFNITPTCSGIITIVATLTGKSSSSTKPAVELKADGVTILSLTNSSSVATETKTTTLAVTAGTAVEIAGVMNGYSTGIANIKFMADVITTAANIEIMQDIVNE